MKQAAIGLRAHSGWAALVAVYLEKGFPSVLVRERVHLVDTFTYEFRQPYHTAERMAFGKAHAFILRMQKEARRLAYRAIHGLQSDLQERGFKLAGCGLLLASGRPRPVLDKILASHALIHAADGDLFREALHSATDRCGSSVTGIKERELLDCAEKAFGRKPADLLHCVTALGRPLGSPWTQDEKFATLAAWLALGMASKGGKETRSQRAV
jgi:hypothetical protein